MNSRTITKKQELHLITRAFVEMKYYIHIRIKMYWKRCSIGRNTTKTSEKKYSLMLPR
jgi:hypothetical protein